MRIIFPQTAQNFAEKSLKIRESLRGLRENDLYRITKCFSN